MVGNSHYFSTFHILDLILMPGLAGSNMSLLVSITVFWLQAQVLQRRGRWWRPSDPRRKRGRTRWKRPELEMETEFLEFTKLRIQGCELIGRPEKVSIGDQLETTFKVKWRPFGYHFEDDWRPIIKSSVVSSNIGSNNFGLRKMALIFLNLASLSLIFNLNEVYKNQNNN